MRLTKYTHACVRLERDGEVLVIDPGGFSEAEAIDGAGAVLITHEHFDHLDLDKLRAATGTFAVYTHPGVAGKLDGLDREVRTVGAGEEFTAAGFRVRAYGGVHAEIHPDVARVPNLGFLVDESVYHPGDSLDTPGSQVDTLLLPVMAPWLKLAEAVDFVRSVSPRRAYAIHDHLLSPAGAMVFHRNLDNLSGCPYEHLEPGTTVDLARG